VVIRTFKPVETFAKGMGMTGQADSEHFEKMAAAGSPRGGRGNIALADDIFSENVGTNGVSVGVARAKRRIQDRLDGFPGLTATIMDMLAAHDKIVTRLVWRGRHTGPYGGTEAIGKRSGSRTLPFGASKMVK
jgi:hypothetical protein